MASRLRVRANATCVAMLACTPHMNIFFTYCSSKLVTSSRACSNCSAYAWTLSLSCCFICNREAIVDYSRELFPNRLISAYSRSSTISGGPPCCFKYLCHHNCAAPMNKVAMYAICWSVDPPSKCKCVCTWFIQVSTSSRSVPANTGGSLGFSAN